MNGREISDDWRIPKVYVRESNKWHVVSFQDLTARFEY